MGNFWGLVPVTNSMVPVPYWFWSTGTGTEFSVPVPNVLFRTSVSVLAITWSFIIQFECFKLLVKLDFKENKTPCNRHLQIMTLCGLEIHSYWGYVQANFWFSFEHRVVPVV